MHFRLTVAGCVLAMAAASAVQNPAHAQVTERPIAFDSVGQVRAVTPALAMRLGLSAPEWPVAGEFVEARLFETGPGTYVIVVNRQGGALTRYEIGASQREALQRAIAAAMAVGGRVVGEENVASGSEPARGAFIRNQMILTAVLYAPAMAYLTHDAKAGTAVWLLATGGSYFLLSQISKQTVITRAQNHLATDGAVRGSLVASGIRHTFGGDGTRNAGAIATLAGSLGGAYTGYRLGRGWTDSEAHSATSGSTLTALSTIGVLAATGIINDSTNDRVASGATVAAALIGYPLGLQYPRRAPYRVTAGDVDLLSLTGALGVMAGSIPVIRESPDAKSIAAALTIGGWLGVVAGDRLLARPFDHTEPEAWRVKLGALAGALVGAAGAVLAEPNATITMSFVTAGGILGTFVADRLVTPARAHRR
jgi:hypothetical protein